ncbi:hypothetical protein ACB092_06G128500 [Castanea dentata]
MAAKLPESPFGSEPTSSTNVRASPSTSGTNNTHAGVHPSRQYYLEQLIVALRNDHTREEALHLLYKSCGAHEDLALLLWHSFGTIYILLKEIIAVYRLISAPELTESVLMRVCNALALLKCVATHPDTRMLFIKARIPLYLYPLLNNTNKESSHERLRLISLGVIGALVKAGDAEVITFLIENQIIDHCIHCMEVGSVLSKTVATFVVHKILLQDEGLKYCCTFAHRFYAVGHTLAKMVENLPEEPSEQQLQLLKHIICCYQRLSQSPRACDGLKFCLPTRLRDATAINLLHVDQTTIRLLEQLVYNVSIGHQSTTKPFGKSLMHLLKG